MAIRLPIGFCNRSGSGDYLIQMRVACAPVHFDKQRNLFSFRLDSAIYYGLGDSLLRMRVPALHWASRRRGNL